MKCPSTIMVAKEAGVSQATVSYVLNGKFVDRISSATRKRVTDAAERLGYTPNSLARAVATGQNRVLGFVQQFGMPEFQTRIELEKLAAFHLGVVLEGEASQYLIKTFPVCDPDSTSNVVTKCLSQRVAGIIVCRTENNILPTLLRTAEIAKTPVVTVDCPWRDAHCPQIVSDDEQGIRSVFDYLVGLGHRRIAFVGGRSGSEISNGRKEHFRSAAHAHGIDVPKEDIIDTCWLDNDIVVRGVTSLLDRPRDLRPTALMCAGDSIAMMSIRVARKNGLDVPKDVTVVGYSNASCAQLSDPPLTTVEQDFTEMGRIAVRILSGAEKSNEHAACVGVIKVPTRLVIRESACEPYQGESK